jgi:hypothetical protein
MGYNVHKPKKIRRAVLRRAGDKYGYLYSARHLLLRANLQQWNENVYDKMKDDVDYLLDIYNKKKIKRQSRNKKIKKNSKKNRKKRTKKSKSKLKSKKYNKKR